MHNHQSIVARTDEGRQDIRQPVPVLIQDATGPRASKINGVYEPIDEICGGMPVYRKQGKPNKAPNLQIYLEFVSVTNQVFPYLTYYVPTIVFHSFVLSFPVSHPYDSGT